MSENPSSQQGKPKPFIGIHMRCCNVYIRAYPNTAKDAFVGWCPRCTSQIRIPIVKEGGNSGNFFEAS